MFVDDFWKGRLRVRKGDNEIFVKGDWVGEIVNFFVYLNKIETQKLNLSKILKNSFRIHETHKTAVFESQFLIRKNSSFSFFYVCYKRLI